jgi:hypothetical protein
MTASIIFLPYLICFNFRDSAFFTGHLVKLKNPLLEDPQPKGVFYYPKMNDEQYVEGIESNNTFIESPSFDHGFGFDAFDKPDCV